MWQIKLRAFEVEEKLTKAKPSKQYDFITSLASAKTFHGLGKKCLEDYIQHHQIKPTEVFAAAVNYGLSIELYLKSLLVMEGKIKVRGHMLDDLYNSLSENTKKTLIKEYKKLDGLDRKEILYIRASLQGSNPANENSAPTRGTKLINS